MRTRPVSRRRLCRLIARRFAGIRKRSDPPQQTSPLVVCSKKFGQWWRGFIPDFGITSQITAGERLDHNSRDDVNRM
jgi:hypothetical protein